MRLALLVFSISFTAQLAHGATAYEALQVLAKARGEALLDAVTEVSGGNGAPQPRVWKIMIKDSKSRGGAKQFSVQGAKIGGEQAVALPAGSSQLNMNQLNLDSDGAHKIAETEAKKSAFAYDHADYVLRTGGRGGTPVWEVRLVDDQSGGAATLNIAATTGDILSSEGFANRTKTATAAPAAPLPEPPVIPAPTPVPYTGGAIRPRPQSGSRATTESWSPGVQRAGDDLSRFIERVGRHMDRRGRQISDAFHNAFTGDNRDTAGPHGWSPRDGAPPPKRENPPAETARPSRIRD